MLLCDLILSNTIRKVIPRLRPGQELVYYRDGRCEVVERKNGGTPKSARERYRNKTREKGLGFN